MLCELAAMSWMPAAPPEVPVVAQPPVVAKASPPKRRRSGGEESLPAEPVASPEMARVTQALATVNTGLVGTIARLKHEQAEARKRRQQLTKDLRNAMRRKRRLKARARQLSNDDLVAVLLMRKETDGMTNGPAPDGDSASGDTEEEGPGGEPSSGSAASSSAVQSGA